VAEILRPYGPFTSLADHAIRVDHANRVDPNPSYTAIEPSGTGYPQAVAVKIDAACLIGEVRMIGLVCMIDEVCAIGLVCVIGLVRMIEWFG